MEDEKDYRYRWHSGELSERLEDLLAAKIAAGRQQDLVDAAKLKKALELERKQKQTEVEDRKTRQQHAKEQTTEQPPPAEAKKPTKRQGRGRKK